MKIPLDLSQYIYDRTEPFNNVNFENLSSVFGIIQEIISENNE
ncbi:hypothetical protein EMIT079MI2_190021 [Bacillus sp. IT-79MI2]